MNVYNPIDAMRRLEASGLERKQAEAIADEIRHGMDDVVTKDYLNERLDATSDRLLIKLGLLVASLIALACTIMGVIFAA